MLKPLGNRLLVKCNKDEKTTKSGIIIKDNRESSIKYAEIIEIGDIEKITLKKGNLIIIEKYAGTEIQYGGNDYIIVETKDVLAIVE